jgi:hypothetical protein
MKTSNKLLLAIFCTIILLTTAIQLMVYAKYKRGEYIPFQRDEIIKLTSINVPAIRFVSVTGLGNCVLINSDTSRLEIDENKDRRITYRVVNDTLIIHGDTAIASDLLEGGSRNYQLIKIFLPATIPVNAAFSAIYVDGAADSAHAPSYSFHLSKNSDLNIREQKKEATYFNQLLINCDNSNISLDDHIIVNDLNLKAVKSEIDNNKASIKNLTLDMDKKSTITLSGNSIKALK